MVKIKTISRSEEAFTRECKGDVVKVFRNLDPSLHPFDKAREYTRALQATKLDKVFAKPFVGALDGHTDGVYCSALSKKSLVQFLSGACDGEVRIWDLNIRKCVWRAYAHSGFVRGLSVAPNGSTFFSCGDKTVKQWDLKVAEDTSQEPSSLNTWLHTQSLTSIDHHWRDNRFATAADTEVLVWDHARSNPIHKFSWGCDAISSVKFNPAETSLLASTGSDRAITLFDTREGSAMRKAVLTMRSNALAWNPQEPLNFTVANEDHNLYTFDMRKLKQAKLIHKDHVGAVMDLAFSPTGQEFVSGSYDRTVRIFGHREGRSREVYHTKRMQRIFCVNFSGDGRFVLTGSDDTNLRIWKAQASKQLGAKVPREEKKIEYMETLKKRYQHMPEIKKIAKHRHVPKAIKKAQELVSIQNDSERRKAENRRKHSRPDSEEFNFVPERKKRVLTEMA